MLARYIVVNHAICLRNCTAVVLLHNAGLFWGSRCNDQDVPLQLWLWVVEVQQRVTNGMCTAAVAVDFVRNYNPAT
jgi:hypothetical protein